MKNKKFIIISIIILIVAIAVVLLTTTGTNKIGNEESDTLTISENSNENTNNKMTKVKLETNHGNIVINLYSDMPITTGNFENLVKKETYDGVIFHRIIQGFMIQGGDPTGTGFGDPSIPNIQDEFTHAGGNKNNQYTLSMANAGPNTGSSQFFINLVDNNFLDTKHCAFGMVVEGIDIINKIAQVQTGANDRPLEDVKIIKASII